jgi:hypothetical protein
MYDPTQDTPALARTSNMNADLGQVSCACIDTTLYTLYKYCVLMHASIHLSGVKCSHTAAST